MITPLLRKNKSTTLTYQLCYLLHLTFLLFSFYFYLVSSDTFPLNKMIISVITTNSTTSTIILHSDVRSVIILSFCCDSNCNILIVSSATEALYNSA